jgi:hypothetical protein
MTLLKEIEDLEEQTKIVRISNGSATADLM